ncbi:helix-turn-helix transcriptional regulator [Aestuariibaculum marinum]|uniref:WYL domain-containing protein n=1 Tax=Aestuariibaculum marinum TaxID=2683592 RepID=A0A8J6PVC5_9FLAO|nr:WYL domain-containing protein [Aestuariibaculum marinum]MBD0824420.1 WYL domain-containing protein [Aestuariibaculum marinum]
MATNKHAQIRYTILDRCFSNFNRKYTYDSLLEEVNAKLYELGTEGIQQRQLKYDIKYMESDEGWSIHLDEDLKDGKKRVLRYKDRGFSIANHPLNVSDSEQLETTLAILSRYKHRTEFAWLEELIPRIEQSFNLVTNGSETVIGYQENIDLKGREHLGVLFNLILKKKQIKLIYEPYGKPQIEVVFNPYYLKQFNNRWFLFGFNPEYQSLSNYPLDRIVFIEELSSDFDASNINWLDYFDDFIGVTRPENASEVEVKLKFTEDRIQYVLTKPLHGTQKLDRSDASGLTILIKVRPNRELYQMLLSYGADLQVIEPSGVRDNMRLIIEEMTKMY